MPVVLAPRLGGRGVQLALLPTVQSGKILNRSPMTPVALPPFTDMPGFTMLPSCSFTNGWQSVPVHIVVPPLIGLSGSQFGTIHGFTQRGCTGVMVPEVPTLAELDELKTSALAVALT